MLSPGSQWYRWEPHIHAPGTVLNNQFSGDDPWGQYLTALEVSEPKIRALAVTDYYVTDTYETCLFHKEKGRLPDVSLIFPNIELRLDVRAKQGFVNIHLLVSPEDSEHINEVHRILSRLRFSAYGDRFDCTKQDLIRLGKKADPSITHDHLAMQHGATQFKVNFRELREVYEESIWAKNNILIAVAGGSGDGTSGLRSAADVTIRQEIEKFAHIIFSSSPQQRNFWTGNGGSMDAEAIRERFKSCKPCLHGSDAHENAKVGEPDHQRRTWIKGSLEFDALRQACIDPAGRAFVGSHPPTAPRPSQVISSVQIQDANWIVTPNIQLNPGLITIIGARGSGKTALADIIAAGCNAVPPATWTATEDNASSFLNRAKSLLYNSSVTLNWGDGNVTSQQLNGLSANSPNLMPRARYLSQQFVEHLCSSKGASDALLSEIERVIYEAHSSNEKNGALNFSELKNANTTRYRQSRNREAQHIGSLSEQISIERFKEQNVSILSFQIEEKQKAINRYTSDRNNLKLVGSDKDRERFNKISAAFSSKESMIRQFVNRKLSFQSLKDEVTSTKTAKAPELLRQAKERHASSYLTETQWEDFLLVFRGDVDVQLEGYMNWVDNEILKLKGDSTATVSQIPTNVEDFTQYSLLQLDKERARLQQLLSADKIISDHYANLTKSIDALNAELVNLNNRLIDSQDAGKRRLTLQSERDDTYKSIFESIVNEQNALSSLYAPLMNRLQTAPGTLGKLGFSVFRSVDTKAWAEFAEDKLLDLRIAGPFQGQGSLFAKAKAHLEPAWKTGDAEMVQAAMTEFIRLYANDIIKHAPANPDEITEFQKWSKNFSKWLYGTEHIQIRYGISYDNIEIEKLSPGTRGIVLLLLYLALDDTDDRPLIIDQPEENLDPKSVFDELVPLFLSAKTRRQVIMVTHNANLVINTDADQVIIAEVGPYKSQGLPPMTYSSGGLENTAIRANVCSILEGGERAFRERARRLRVHLER